MLQSEPFSGSLVKMLSRNIIGTKEAGSECCSFSRKTRILANLKSYNRTSFIERYQQQIKAQSQKTKSKSKVKVKTKNLLSKLRIQKEARQVQLYLEKLFQVSGFIL